MIRFPNGQLIRWEETFIDKKSPITRWLAVAIRIIHRGNSTVNKDRGVYTLDQAINQKQNL